MVMRYAVSHVYPNDNSRTPWTDPIDLGFTSMGDLFSHLQYEYGRCTGKVRVDRPDEEGVPVGWIFEKRLDGTLSQTWVVLIHHTEAHGDVQKDLRTV